jgi:hypothetical protein
MMFYASAMFLFAGIGYYLSRVRKNIISGISGFFDLEHFLIMLMGFTGLSQLYPLRDNIHLWFVSPLLMVSASFYFRSIKRNSNQIKKSLVVILSCLVFVQSIALFRFIHVDREPLSSYALRGLISDSKYQHGIANSMHFLDENLSERVLRNNCVDSLFSVAKGKYVSVDGNFSANSFGNFTDSVPVVDASPTGPSYVFECRLFESRIQEIVRDGAIIVFRSLGQTNASPGEESFDVLFQIRGAEFFD